MSDPLVSVVVPSFNRAPFLRATIDSILAQDYPHIECVVMDGGSTDETVEILRSYGDRIKWTSEPDKGQADAIDSGLRHSSGAICAWLNVDDLWLRASTISLVVRQFEDDADADVIYGECTEIDAAGAAVGESYVVRGWSLRYAIEYADHCIPQPSAFIRRRALERVNYLNTSLIFMDRDLWLRVGIGGKIKHVPIRFAAARTHENHWHVKHREAAEEWIETSARILREPSLPIEIRRLRRTAMANACLRAMHYAWIGRRLGETIMIGARALRYRPSAVVPLVSQAAQFAEQAGRPVLAATLRFVECVSRGLRRIGSWTFQVATGHARQ